MIRVTYGIASSSFHSTRCLKEVAKRTCNSKVQIHLEHSFYVDDFLGGANSVEDARKLIADLHSKLLKYGFPLRKWASSCFTLIKELPDELRETANECEILSDDYKIKALGIIWKPNLDIICFKTDLPAVTVFTKRSLLSVTANLYDPMGWLSPIIIVFKILLQQIWLTGVKWDKLVPEPIKQQFLQHYSELKKLSQILMPRAIVKNAIQDLQLLVFCDASEKAYAAVSYARTTDVFGNVSSHLITSKTKVAPVKVVSMPRLELCGAHLAAKLLEATMSTLQITGLEQSFDAWTDSIITLQWLSQLPRTWTTIVANRVSYIQEIIKRDSWNHVPTNDNPADLASRGLSVEDTVNCRLWWSGPEWLPHPKSYWPQLDVQSSSVLPEKHELKETSKAKNRTFTPVEATTLTSSQRLNSSTQVLPTEKFCSFNKLINVVSNVIRFINALRIRIDCHTPQTEAETEAETEIRRIAIAKIIRQDQIQTFPDEYAILRR